ncbi:hypothetical protein [Sedimenticola selenatireducens]|uniref:hypothetical protein n=1 Tax=Sedimenticola selenatireducens TaxID=191960 RepID=UPI0004918B46|nr:hypothetical protein [Sedimenticola selenatireducens]
MPVPAELTDALNAAAIARANAEMRVFILEDKVLAARGADKDDPKYPQYKNEYKEALGIAQQAKGAMGPARSALRAYYQENPADLDALFGIV